MDEQALKEFYKKLDRSHFVSDTYKPMAQVDSPLPIGHEQTISQPSLVFAMTRLLSPEKDSKVLEIGTGSGYQTALLAQFSAEVYTIERIGELSKSAQQRLLELGYSNISYRIGDGSAGWQEHAPFDRIIVTAAAGKKPAALIDQLNANGRMIVPVGPRRMQELLLITKNATGSVREQTIEYVRFVEMVGEYGWGD